jgi:hypothetical protein
VVGLKYLAVFSWSFPRCVKLRRASSVLKTGKSESRHSASRGALTVVVGHERIIRSVESAALEASLAQMPNIEGSVNEMEANQMWWSETRASGRSLLPAAMT